ncbi:MAG: hypothetical protein AAF485_32720, partial [Chloroflexota bacterium]
IVQVIVITVTTFVVALLKVELTKKIERSDGPIFVVALGMLALATVGAFYLYSTLTDAWRYLLATGVFFGYGTYLLILFGGSIESKNEKKKRKKAEADKDADPLQNNQAKATDNDGDEPQSSTKGQPVQTPRTWKALAETHQLAYRGGSSLFNRPEISGSYRNHALKLWNAPSQTVLTVTINAAANELLNNQRLLDTIPVEQLTKLLTEDVKFSLKGGITINPESTVLQYEQSNPESDVAYLQTLFDLLCDLAEAYPVVAQLGGEAVAGIQQVAIQETHTLRNIAFQLLKDIGRETTARLGERSDQLICPRCWAKCQQHQAHTLRLHTFVVTYYGCRICHQSRQFLEGQAVAVLDSQMPEAYIRQAGQLRINWLQQGKLFDFDRVEIIRASDELVERFAMQVGNDTDTFRKPFYPTIPCLIASECELSENSWRVLKHTFGTVAEL